MAQTITTSAMDLVAAANAQVRMLSIDEAVALHGKPDVVFIDIRDVREVAKTGKVAGAHHVPRGMLEFWIDPKSPYYKPFFGADALFVFYCAGGWRSALSAKTAQDMGLKPVAHMDGGMKAWIDKGAPIDAPKDGAKG